MPAPNKAYRQSLRRRARNRPVLTLSRTSLAEARAALAAAPKAPETADRVKSAITNLAKAGRKGAIHPNNASRHIARLMKAANKAAR
jgi:small subunit ribosomal protein S20